MKEGRKIYSLLLKDENEVYYRVKIEEEYHNPLAVIDAFTVTYPSKDKLYLGFSDLLETNIIGAKVVYQKDGKTKALEPIYADMKELGDLALAFGKTSEVGADNHSVAVRINIFAQKLLKEYTENMKIRVSFNQHGDYIVNEALQNNDLVSLIKRLCEYRKPVILKKETELGQPVDVYPLVFDLKGAKIIKTDERFLELNENKIRHLQLLKPEDSLTKRAWAIKLEQLYTKREELLKSLDRKEDKNQVPGQTKMMF